MSEFECPNCHRTYDVNDYPDHLSSMRGDRFTFEECECGIDFDVSVDWEPYCYVLSDSSRARPTFNPAPLTTENENG